jgi:hypothetical protein
MTQFRLKGTGLWTQVPPCFQGPGVVDGWKHIANVLEYESDNPGIELLQPVGLDALENMCRAVRAMKAVTTITAPRLEVN